MSQALSHEVSPLAKDALNSFEAILDNPTIWRPDDIPSWMNNYIYRIGKSCVSLHDSEAYLLARQAEGEFDPSDNDAIWHGRGFVSYGPWEGNISPDIGKELYVLGRRFSRGDPSKAIVQPAIVVTSSRLFLDGIGPPRNRRQHYPFEDVNSNTERLTKLAGWLEWITGQSSKQVEATSA